MAGNPQRGEVALVIDRVERRMRLTLGALAALEARLETGGLVALAERFEEGTLSTGDLIAVLSAGLAGAGETVTEADLASAEIEGGASAALAACVALLAQGFGTGEAGR